jgi:uncharacterized membrane protein
MIKIERTATINAPIEKVFEYVAEPTNLPEIWPSMIEVKDVKHSPQHVGDTFHWTYKMVGMRFEGDTKTTEYVPNERLVTQSTGAIPSTFVYTFKKENGHTLFHEEVEYAIPNTLLNRLAEPFIRKANEDEADAFVANLKVRMET